MKRSRQVVLAITSGVVLAACDRSGEPRPQLASAAESSGRGLGSEMVESVPEPIPGANVAGSTNGLPASGSRPYSGGRTYFYPGYHTSRLIGSAPSGTQPAGSSAPTSGSHGSVSRGGFGAHGSSHASAAG